MFRLHIDIPLGMLESDAVDFSNDVIAKLAVQIEGVATERGFAVNRVQYRLADDGDRAVRNYLAKDCNGHASTKKSVVEF